MDLPKLLIRGEILYKKKNNTKFFNGNEVKNNLFPRMLGSLPNTSDSIKPSVWNCLYSVELIKNII